MTEIIQEIRHESGIPLGGIGTGSVEIRPDGLFHEWQIFNTGHWSPNSPCSSAKNAEVPLDSFLFYVRTRTPDGRITVRHLALHSPLNDLYSFPWIRCVKRIRFEGHFPVARLVFEDPDLPVEVILEAFSPFVMHDSALSGTPGFYLRLKVRNRTSEPVEFSVLGLLENLAGIGQGGRNPRTRLMDEEASTTAVFFAEGLADGECTTGDLAFSLSGGERSWIGGAFRHDHRFPYMASGYGFKNYSYLKTFRDHGELPNLATEAPPELPEGFRADSLSMEEKHSLLREMLQHTYVYHRFRILRAAEPELEDSETLLNEFLDDIARNLRGDAYPAGLNTRDWGTAALCGNRELGPAESAEFLFTLAWHFPHHRTPTGADVGHMYQNWFSGALEVSRFLRENYRDIEQAAFLLPRLLHESSLPEAVAEAVSGQLSTLVKCTWWTQDGLFGVWEGLGCCGFHTIDITYQGSFPILALFPDLQKTQMLHGTRFQREDGRVHHLFTPDFSKVDNDFDRVDMNPQFVMLAARDYEWTKDREYLEKIWPHVIRAMESTALLDTDEDGLPDVDTRRNTYDVWDFSGCPAYIASLWLGALRAAVRLAGAMNDPERAALWNETLNRGMEAFENLLWNGRYYVLWKDPKTGVTDECLMSDQLSGEWFSAVMGWGTVSPSEKTRKALESIFRHNFHPGTGLVNATYPPGTRPRVPTSANLQTEATWTGIEYSVASLLIENGMIGEGLAIVEDIHERYLRAGKFWNHVECGWHYYRALSSWTLLVSLSGFRLNAEAETVEFAPATRADKTVYPFIAPGAAGRYSETHAPDRNEARLEVATGTLTLREISLPKMGFTKAPTVLLNGKHVRVSFMPPGRIFFEEGITIGAREEIRFL